MSDSGVNAATNVSTTKNNNLTIMMPPIDKETHAARSAAARAYALSSTTTSSYRRKKTNDDSYQTPPMTTTRMTMTTTTRPPKKPTSRMSAPPTAHSERNEARRGLAGNYEDDEDYALFVSCLMSENLASLPTMMDDDDEEYAFPSLEDDEDDDDDEELEFDMERQPLSTAALPTTTPDPSTPMNPPETLLDAFINKKKDDEDDDDDDDDNIGIDDELGGLLEEDLEAAVTTLLGNPSPTPQASTKNGSDSPRTPLRESARNRNLTITKGQSQRLQQLLAGHYQLLLQQALLSVRQLHVYKTQGISREPGQESSEDLAEILDGAVGMLQDLEQNRKDAIRNSIIQMPPKQPSARRALHDGGGRLTRAAFTKTLQQPLGSSPLAKTAFDIKGLDRLAVTFATMDQASKTTCNTNKNAKASNLLDLSSHADACRRVLAEAGADLNENFLPGAQDESDLLSSPEEALGVNFTPPCSLEQRQLLRRDRNQFTAAEDSLVFRGVNLYGEKQWMLIADRFLPDRSINIIAQRYSKLSLLLYRAHNIRIDKDGNLDTPPKHESIDHVNEAQLSVLHKVEPPAILNVHRWSIEEDLTLLKAVPILGHMWAELSTRLIPHRDRGHLRKRYQVLERRIKATVNRTQGIGSTATSNRPSAPRKNASTKRKIKANAVRQPKNGTSKSNRKLPLKQREEKQVLPALPQANNLELGQAEPTVEPIQAIASPSSNTRQGVENILNDNGDWSQASKLDKLMQDEGMGVEGGARAGAIETLPHMDLDPATCSGFSVLNDPGESNPGDSKVSPSGKSRGRLLESVLERTRGKDDGTPRQSASSFLNQTVPFSPMETTARLSLLSPASSNVIMSTTPSAHLCLGNDDDDKSEFSPQLGNLLLNGNSADCFDVCNFTISEQSRQAFEAMAHNNSNTPNREQMPPPTPLTGQSLFRDEDQQQQSCLSTDMAEAVSALNSMSNSPSHKKKNESDEEEEEEERKKRGLFNLVMEQTANKKQRTA